MKLSFSPLFFILAGPSSVVLSQTCKEVCDSIENFNCVENYAIVCDRLPIGGCSATVVDAASICPVTTGQACLCDNPPPDCPDCSEINEKSNCQQPYTATCAKDFNQVPYCVSAPLLDTECTWGLCNCPNPPPPCPDCVDVIARNPFCDLPYIHTCPNFEVPDQCLDSPNATNPSLCSWGPYCTCTNPSPAPAPTSSSPTSFVHNPIATLLASFVYFLMHH